jgi:hypothetical protein
VDFSAKVASALNPLVYALSHPKYREALVKEFPFIRLGKFDLAKNLIRSSAQICACKPSVAEPAQSCIILLESEPQLDAPTAPATLFSIGPI